MILTTLANADALVPLHPRFAAALTWLRSSDLTALAPGRQEIDGAAMFAIVETGQAHDPATRRLESHHRYIDWQLNLDGGECIRVAASAGLTMVEDRLEQDDLAFYHPAPAAATSDLRLQPGSLAVFWPADAHMPSLRLNPASAHDYRKIVVKIRLGE